jgi:hypothetical protein
LEKSPNTIDNSSFTFWTTEYQARDEMFAMAHITQTLGLLIGQLNYAMHFHRTQLHSSRQGPWPDRWADLRHPFVYLLYQDGEFQHHYYDETDGSLREPDSPHSIHEEHFQHVFDWLPDFTSEEPLDDAIINATHAFQEGIIEPDERESLFRFWRGIEIMTHVDREQNSGDVVDRAGKLMDWDDNEVANIRTQRVIDKRNQYVHEGGDVRVTTQDRNLVKSFLEVLIDFASERREEWSIQDWEYIMANFKSDKGEIDHSIDQIERNLQLLEWMKTLGEERRD